MFFLSVIEFYSDLIYMYVCKISSWRFEPRLLPYTPQNTYICEVTITPKVSGYDIPLLIKHKVEHKKEYNICIKKNIVHHCLNKCQK